MGNSVAFDCKICGVIHLSTETIQHFYNGVTYPGVAKIPDELVSARNSKQEYFLKCAGSCPAVDNLEDQSTCPNCPHPMKMHDPKAGCLAPSKSDEWCEPCPCVPKD